MREVVRRTLPRRAGERHIRLFRLARSLRDLFPAATPALDLGSVVSAWWRLSRPVIGTQLWAVTWADFLRAWREVKIPMADSRPKRAMRAAAGASAGLGNAGRLLAVCRGLALEVNGRDFFLSCRDAAEQAGVCPEPPASYCVTR